MAQRDARNRGNRLGALSNDVAFEGLGVGAASGLHEISA